MPPLTLAVPATIREQSSGLLFHPPRSTPVASVSEVPQFPGGSRTSSHLLLVAGLFAGASSWLSRSKRRSACSAVSGSAANAAGPDRTEATESESPQQLLRHWRWSRRNQLQHVVAAAWLRTDSLPRGVDAGFQFQNVGPLVGCPPLLWVYFVDTVEHWARASHAKLLFQRVCDRTLSYSVLNCSDGCLPASPPSSEPAAAKGRLGAPPSKGAIRPGPECGTLAGGRPTTFKANFVFNRYDLVVAMDDGVREQVERLSRHAEEAAAAARKLCTLSDFLDVCEGHWPSELLGQRSANAHSSGSVADFSDAPNLRHYPDLPADSDPNAPDVLALSVAGLERFLIAQFPAQLKDRLHPYLIPRGLQ